MHSSVFCLQSPTEFTSKILNIVNLFNIKSVQYTGSLWATEFCSLMSLEVVKCQLWDTLKGHPPSLKGEGTQES